MLRILLCCLMLLASLSAAAQSTVYRTVDERGNVVFTDTPPAGGVSSKEVEVPPANTSAPPPSIPPRENPEEESIEKTSVAITQPTPETTIPMGPGNFSVAASVKPALAQGWSVQLFMDGEAKGAAQQSASWNLTNVFRGEHQLTVKVTDADGKIVATSEPVVVYVQRPSVN